ncbi:hypothetical protein QJ48_04085 [Paenibacillus sp. A3]|uniref:phage tail assembly chaperone n=1 Tax=Paenibacillus sp. A3 TaxID=1337054 RepID=UPI0006D531B6|nr:hypothetical protein [Paenibacillus sp. A3]KPV60716.1 hypothetical protein QJ48_04085 [Paenibacillus sp. A3]
MNPIENYKNVEINGRTFRIKKFDALTGSFMLIKITGLLAPLFKNLDLRKLKEAKDASEVKLEALNIPGLLSELGNLSEKDFEYVQGKCLQVCSEVLPAGPTPVLNSNGTFGVTGIEDDTMTVLALTAHTLIFNVKGFFSGSPLASLVGGLLNTSQQD